MSASALTASDLRVPLGRLLATPAALRLLDVHEIDLLTLLSRHARGDWGDVDAGDARANDAAVCRGGRLISAYVLASTRERPRVWVITEADRSATTVLLPEEY